MSTTTPALHSKLASIRATLHRLPISSHSLDPSSTAIDAANKKPPTRPLLTTATSEFDSSDDSSDSPSTLSIIVCFILGYVIHIAGIYALLRWMHPWLPVAFFTFFAGGYGTLLFIGKLQDREEEVWVRAARLRVKEEEKERGVGAAGAASSSS